MRNARIASIYLDRAWVATRVADVRILEATPLLREMVIYAGRWSPLRGPQDATADAFFRALGALCAEWIERPLAARMPRGESPEVRAAVDYIRAHVADATLEGAARTARVSTRTLRRRLHDELGASFRELLGHARAIRALELLGDPARRVTDVALALGYDSLSAFTKTFASFAGETPSAYRARLKQSRAVPPTR